VLPKMYAPGGCKDSFSKDLLAEVEWVSDGTRRRYRQAD
jgi:hypothetical protein